MNRRRGRLEHTRQMDRRGRAPRDFLGLESNERARAELLDTRERRVPCADLRGARRGPQPAIVPELRVDPVLRAESADLGDAASGCIRKS